MEYLYLPLLGTVYAGIILAALVWFGRPQAGH